MDNRRLPGGNPRRLAVLFLAVVAPPAAALMWPGWQVAPERQVARGATGSRSSPGRRARRGMLIGAIPDGSRAFQRGRTGTWDGAVHCLVHWCKAQPANRIFWVPAPPAMPSAATAP